MSCFQFLALNGKSPPHSVVSGKGGTKPAVTPVSLSMSSLLTHRIKMEEVAPSASSLIEGNHDNNE